MANTAKTAEEQAIERFIAARGVKRLPPATAHGIGPSRWAPNAFRKPETDGSGLAVPHRRCNCEFPASKIMCDGQCAPRREETDETP